MQSAAPEAGLPGCAVFRFFRFRFHFRAVDPLHFPTGKAGNTLRGALGMALMRSASPAVFAGLFQPGSPGAPRRVLDGGVAPSGLADPPRPFVLRADRLDGLRAAPGRGFSVDVHAFEAANPPLAVLRRSFESLAAEGIGPGRGRAALDRIEQLGFLEEGMPVTDVPAGPPLALDLGAAAAGPVARVRLRFVTPTDLKAGGGPAERPEFAVLFGRLRDRIGTLAAFYGGGPLPVDYRGLGERSRKVLLTRAALGWRRTQRRSSRTGQSHSLGGFTGEADYAGDLGEFLPWLAAARWVGVGRHTVWGQGDVRVIDDCHPA